MLSTRALIQMSLMPAGRMDRLQSTALASRKSLAVTKPRFGRARCPGGSPASPIGVSPVQVMRCEQLLDVPRCATARSVEPGNGTRAGGQGDQKPRQIAVAPVKAQVFHRSHGAPLLREVERRLVGRQQDQDPDGEMSHLKLLEERGPPAERGMVGAGSRRRPFARPSACRKQIGVCSTSDCQSFASCSPTKICTKSSFAYGPGNPDGLDGAGYNTVAP